MHCKLGYYQSVCKELRRRWNSGRWCYWNYTEFQTRALLIIMENNYFTSAIFYNFCYSGDWERLRAVSNSIRHSWPKRWESAGFRVTAFFSRKFGNDRECSELTRKKMIIVIESCNEPSNQWKAKIHIYDTIPIHSRSVGIGMVRGYEAWMFLDVIWKIPVNQTDWKGRIAWGAWTELCCFYFAFGIEPNIWNLGLSFKCSCSTGIKSQFCFTVLWKVDFDEITGIGECLAILCDHCTELLRWLGDAWWNVVTKFLGRKPDFSLAFSLVYIFLNLFNCAYSISNHTFEMFERSLIDKACIWAIPVRDEPNCPLYCQWIQKRSSITFAVHHLLEVDLNRAKFATLDHKHHHYLQFWGA
jgi:hypothetical protein